MSAALRPLAFLLALLAAFAQPLCLCGDAHGHGVEVPAAATGCEQGGHCGGTSSMPPQPAPCSDDGDGCGCLRAAPDLQLVAVDAPLARLVECAALPAVVAPARDVPRAAAAPALRVPSCGDLPPPALLALHCVLQI